MFPLLVAATLVLQPFVSGLDRPVQVVDGHDGFLYAAQQNGAIVRIDPHDGTVAPYRDLSGRVQCCTNGSGMLSIVFHPVTHELYAQYVDRDGNTAIAREGGWIIIIPQPAEEAIHHHGGTLQFGPDGFLYASVGDGGADPISNRAQDPNLLLGKLLRIDQERGTAEVWSRGLRNPWRFSFDRLTGELYLADVGQDQWEEVNVLTIDAAHGANFGWPFMEGTHCAPLADCSAYVTPRYEYSHAEGCSVTGGYVYRGMRQPALYGRYLYGDFCTGRLWIDGRAMETGMVIVSFGEDDGGELYLVDYRGSIVRVAAEGLRRRAVAQ
jgi:glucose/arabinose dehydrogenase